MKFFQSITAFLFLAILLALAPAALAGDEVLNNASIIELQGLNLGDAIVIQKINTSKCNFDTSIAGLKQLKAANVSGAVIAAMMAAGTPAATPATMAPPEASGDPNDPRAPHPPGIYYEDESSGKPVLSQMDPTGYSGQRGGVAWWAGYGQSVKNRALLSSAHATLQSTNRQPVFYFYFEGAGFGVGGAYMAGSPGEFVLAQLECDEKRGQRSLVIGEFNAYSGSHIGPDTASVRPFDAIKIAQGIYKVTPKRPLGNGEYGFFVGGEAYSGRVFDFGVHSTADVAASPADANTPITDPEVAALCASLSSDKPSEVEHALKELRKKYAPEAIPKILPCLNDSHPNVVRDACRTLAVLGSKNLIPYLQPLLSSPRADVRKDAQDAIDKLQGN